MNFFIKLYAIKDVEDTMEYCYYIELRRERDKISQDTWDSLYELIEQQKKYITSHTSFLSQHYKLSPLKEFGPNLSVTTAWSANALSILNKSGINSIRRIERSIRTVDMEFYYKNFDKMTQIVYPEPLVSLRSNSNISNQNPLHEVPVAI